MITTINATDTIKRTCDCFGVFRDIIYENKFLKDTGIKRLVFDKDSRHIYLQTSNETEEVVCGGCGRVMWKK